MCVIYCVSMVIFRYVFYLDDMLIKLWNWDKNWQLQQVFEGHTHYVMQVVINPKDNNQFASASLDRTIKVGKTLLPLCVIYQFFQNRNNCQLK